MDEVTMRLEETLPPVCFASFDIQVVNDDSESVGSRLKKNGTILGWILAILGGLYFITWLVTTA
jgi:hypothetical protein